MFRNLDTHIGILKEAYTASIVSVDRFQQWVFDAFRRLGVETEAFRVDAEEVKTQPAFRKTFSNGAGGEKGPRNIVCRLNPSSREGILFFAHADKAPITYGYGKEHPEILEKEGRFVGAGIADDVAGISAMVSALGLYLELGYEPDQQILMASILGKQGGVFGTYGLMKRYGPLGSAVYLHPAESGAGLSELKVASNGLIEFSLSVEGKPPDSTEVHQTIFSNSAVSAVEKAIYLHQKLQAWAKHQSKRYHHPAVDAMAGQSLAVTVGRFDGGADNEVFEIPTACTMTGILCFPPGARLEQVKAAFASALDEIAGSDPWLSQGHWRLRYGDRIAESAESNIDSAFLKRSTEVVQTYTGRTPKYFYGHSMSDIRYPALFWKAQAYGIGPLSGDLGKASEWVDRDEYFLTIAILVELMRRYAT